MNKKQKNQKFFCNSFFPKNYKADIPVTILVIGIFAICSLALLSFCSSDILVKHSFVGVGLIENINAEIEQYSFSNSLNNLNLKNINGKWFFYQEKKIKKGFLELEVTDKFPYFKRKEKLLFSVKYPVPE